LINPDIDVSMQLRGILSECIQQLGSLDWRLLGILPGSEKLVTAPQPQYYPGGRKGP